MRAPLGVCLLAAMAWGCGTGRAHMPPDGGGPPPDCAPVSDGVYTVDPLAGSDLGTGASAPDGCAFKTLTHALAVIGASPPPGTVIQIRPTAELSLPAETSPLTVPANTTIRGLSNDMGPPTLSVSFVLSSPASGLDNLAISRNNIVVQDGADESTTIKSTTVTYATGDCIDVWGGSVTIEEGTHGDSCGSYAEGGLVVGQGKAIIDAPMGSEPISFSSNSGYGIIVNGDGAVEIHGVADPTAHGGTVMLQNNEFSGVAFWIDPAMTQPPSTIDGIYVLGSGGGPAIELSGGSHVSLRNSVLETNTAGIAVERQATQGGPISDDVSGIDLGTAASPGRNVIHPYGTTVSACGIRLDLADGAGAVLAAQGNIFGRTDCLTGGMLTADVPTVGCNGTDLEISASSDIDVASCTHD